MTTGRDDAAVFTRIFDRHRHAVHAFFLGRVSDPELARDLVQETFLRVWRRLSEVGPLPDGQQRAWIFTVARNLAIDSYPPAPPAGPPRTLYATRPRPGRRPWPPRTPRPSSASAWPDWKRPSAGSPRTNG
jgi:hypothetical protein